jgi:hypothetical protein
MAKFPQPSLSAGELSPGMRGRVDMARYYVALGRARNFITKPTGGGAKRPGTRFRGYVKYSDRITRLLPFVYSTEVKYLVEMGHHYMRFWVDGALLTNSQKAITGITNASPAVVTSAAHGFTNGQQVVIQGVSGLTRVNGRTFTVAGATTNTFQLAGFDSSGDPAYAAGGSAGRIVEVATPYTEAMLRDVRFTQSADVLFLVHGEVAPQELRRTGANAFQLRTFAFKRGPFRGFNTDEAALMTVSAATGSVTVETNVDYFTSDMVGSLLYLEEKELRGVKPWASGEKNIAVGTLRRSDSKVYRVASVPSNKGSMGTPYHLTGGSRPVHDVGRAFDGPQDVKDDGVNSYAVGVEWEFVHNTFGLLQITSYVNAREVRATVIERIPDSCVGSLPSPSNTWTFSGNGSQVEFDITGAGSYSYLDYSVKIAGTPVQSNPSYPGGGGVGGGGGGNPRPGNDYGTPIQLV